jgi:hypothetical protein
MNLVKELQTAVKELNPADLINVILSKVHYKEYLVKEE